MQHNESQLHGQKQILGIFTKYLPEFVYGGIDGIVTTFAVVAGATGANLDLSIVLILGFANLFADGFSMSVGAYLSAKSEIKQTDRKKPLSSGLATFLAFVVFGFIPLLTYVISFWGNLGESSIFSLSIALTALAFIAIGIMKIGVTHTHWIRSVLETLILGGLAAGVAYYVGFFLEKLIAG